jgi:hypothetical protein
LDIYLKISFASKDTASSWLLDILLDTNTFIYLIFYYIVLI